MRTPRLFQGEIETIGDFEEVSKSPLFAELEEEEQVDEHMKPPAFLRQRAMSVLVNLHLGINIIPLPIELVTIKFGLS